MSRTISILILVALVCIWAVFPRASAQSKSHNLVILTDAGCDIDDQFAITHLLLTPQLKVLGIISTHAPNLAQAGFATRDTHNKEILPSETTAAVVREVESKLPKRFAVPVITGATKGISQTGWEEQSKGADFILRAAKRFNSQNRLTIVCLGPVTDLGIAVANDSSLSDRIKVVAFGFNRWPDGTDRFNVKHDVNAWKILMESQVPITVACCDVAVRDCYLSREKGREILFGRGRSGEYLLYLLNKIRNPELAQKITGRELWPIYDEEVTAYLLGMATTKSYPRPRLNFDTSFDQASADSTKTIEWITAVDSASLWKDLEQKLSLKSNEKD